MKVEEEEHRYEDRFKLEQPARNPGPYHDQERPATHLKKLEEGVIESENLAEPADRIRNTATSDQVQVQARRSYGDLESTSKYLDETDLYLAGTKAGDESEGISEDEMFEGEGLEEMVKGVGAGQQEQGQGCEDTDSEGKGAGVAGTRPRQRGHRLQL